MIIKYFNQLKKKEYTMGKLINGVLYVKFTEKSFMKCEGGYGLCEEALHECNTLKCHTIAVECPEGKFLVPFARWFSKPVTHYKFGAQKFMTVEQLLKIKADENQVKMQFAK